MKRTTKPTTPRRGSAVAVSPPAPTSAPSDKWRALALVPSFRVEFRRKHDEDSPLESMVVTARTLASARHLAKLAHPEMVIVNCVKI